PEVRKQWVADWATLGITHMWIAPTVSYGAGKGAPVGRSGRWGKRIQAYGTRSYERSIDCRQDPPRFLQCVSELRAAGIIPYVQIAQPETYGTKDHLNMGQLEADLAQWERWGWVAAVDGCGVDLWPESDADTY